MSESRRALRDFYKLPENALSSSTSDAGSELGGPPGELIDEASRSTSLQGQSSQENIIDVMPELEEEPLTTMGELDQPNPDVSNFVSKLAENQTLPNFISTITQIKREQVALESAQRELVNDNYKKLIKAAEMLSYVSKQGDLANLEELTDSIDSLSEWFSKLPGAPTKN